MRKNLLTAAACLVAALSVQAFACPEGTLPVTVEKDAAIILTESKSGHPTEFSYVCYGGQEDPAFHGCEVGPHCYNDGEEIVLSYPDIPNLFNTGHLNVEKKYIVEGEGLNIKVTAPDGSAEFQCQELNGQPCVPPHHAE